MYDRHVLERAMGFRQPHLTAVHSRQARAENDFIYWATCDADTYAFQSAKKKKTTDISQVYTSYSHGHVHHADRHNELQIDISKIYTHDCCPFKAVVWMVDDNMLQTAMIRRIAICSNI